MDFALSLQRYISPHAADIILQGYSITETATDEQAYLNILRFSTDLWYQAPAYGIAERFRDRTSVLHFNEPNPWKGPFQGESTHILDVAFLFQNYNEYLPKEQRNTAVCFGRDIISFANGRPLNDSMKGDPAVIVYENGVSSVGRLEEETLHNSNKIAAICKSSGASLDELLVAWEDFLFRG